MTRGLVFMLLLVLAAGACRDTYVLPVTGDANAMPLAHAGTGSTVQLGTVVDLDGSGSFDPDGQLVSYRWELVALPWGSAAALSSPMTRTSSFVADVTGTYVLALTVQDDAGGFARDQVTFEAKLLPLTTLAVDAGPDTTIAWLARGQVTGSASGTNGFTPTVTWEITERPFHSSATLDDAATLTPSFIADAQGTYTLEVTATAGGAIATDAVTVTAFTAGQSFGGPAFDVPAAVAYSAALDRLIVLRGSPPAVSVIDPATGLGPTVVLPVVFPEALSLALHSSGLRAAAGVPNEVVIVDLQTVSVEGVFAVASSNRRIAFAADNRVHSIPEIDTENIVTLDVATGMITEVATFGDSLAFAMHPAGAAIYLVDTAAPAIARYDLTSRPIALQRQASTAEIGSLYFTSDGSSIVTGGGLVLHSSTDAALDMTVRGSLMTSTYIEAVAHSAITHEIVTLSASVSTSLRYLSWFDDATFAHRFTAPFVDPLTLNDYGGGFITYRGDGQRMYIVGSRGNEWTVFTVSPPP